MIKQSISVVTSLCLVASINHTAPAHGRRVADVDVPDTSEVAGRTLVLNGAALYEASFLEIDIFVAALYLEKPTRSGRSASSCEGPVEFDFFWLYEPSLSQIEVPWRDTMRANAGANLGRLEARIEQLIKALRAPVEGQRWRFAFAPDKGLTFSIDGAPIVTVPGQDFCQLFMGGHVGEHADETMRRGLLGH